MMRKKIINTLFLIYLLSFLVACSTVNKKLTSKKGAPQNISVAFAPDLSAAYKAYQEGRLSDAETLFIRYTNKHPSYSEAWFKLGNIYYRTGQYVAAITAYNNVVQQNPQHGKAWYNMALTRVKQAEQTLERGESILPVTNIQRQRLIALKNKIRSGVRQRRVNVRKTMSAQKPKKTARKIVTTHKIIAHKPGRDEKRK